MNQNYGGVVWTHHALQRLRERNITQQDAWATFQHPDQSRYAKSQGGWIYYKTYGDQKIEVVAKQNEKKQWIILTVWSRPVYEKRHAKHAAHTKGDGIFMRILKKLLFG